MSALVETANRCILITGGEGFIGRHLMAALCGMGISYDIKSGNDILDRKKLDEAMKVADVVVHLAAVSSLQDVDNNPVKALETNIIGTWNVLDLAKKHGVDKVILASSAATKQPELSIYGTSKDCMDRIAALFDNVVIARFYNIYGDGSKSVVNKFVTNIKAGKTVILNGNTRRDYVWIYDLVDKLLEIIYNQDKRKLIEIGTGRSTTLKQLVNKIERVLGIKAKIHYKPPIREIQQSVCQEKMGMFTSLTEGIRQL